MCVLTHTIHPEVCHIVPFAFNSSTTNVSLYTSRFESCLPMFFPPSEVFSYCSLIEASLGASDKAWNMLSLNPYLHAWWAKPHWGIECVGIVPRGEKHAVVMLFHWMPHKKGDPRRTIRVEPGTNDCQRMVDALVEGSYGEGRGPDQEGYANAIQHSSFRPIVTGQEFEIALDTLEEANNMRKMINIQWACVRVAAMSGAAGPDDLAEDFSEFDFEREAFEREMMLRDSDDDDDH